MSGPKVVRIVTREELVDICQGHLARVDAALERWIRIGQRNECLDETMIAAARQRRDKLAALLAADRFMDLQKQAPLEEQFLRDDIEERLAAAARQQAAARTKERRGAQASAAVLAALRKSGTPMAAELEQALERGDSDATGRALLSLAPAERGDLDRALIDKLKTGEAATSLAEWIARSQAEAEDPAAERIALRITQIAQLDPAAARADWDTRLSEARAQTLERRHLILDALEVETGRSLTAVRQRRTALDSLDAVLAEARAAGIDGEAWSRGIESCGIEEINVRIGNIGKAIDDRRKAAAAAASRTALLRALGDLGYELNEGMATAWASEGRLVLRSSSRPEYGVEVSGNDRVQMKPVAFEHGGVGPDTSRDVDAETVWCGDVTRIQKALSEQGNALHIEKALPVGAVPLKRIAVSGTDPQGRTTVPTRQERSIR